MTQAIRHVVLFRFNEACTPAQVDEVLSAFAKLPEQIPDVQSYEAGPNVSPEGLDQGYTHCFLISFADTTARDRYLVHPAHLAFVELVKPRLAQALVVDFANGGQG
jgi:hypothetical protein